MRRLVLCLVCWLLGLSTLRAAEPLLGDWIGGFERNGDWVFVQMRFTPITDGYVGMINLIEFPVRESHPLAFLSKQLDYVKQKESQAHFEITVGTNHCSFDGTLTNALITGKVDLDGKKYPFRLDFTPPVLSGRYAGIYRVGPDHYLTLQRPGGGINGLISVDSQSGQSRMLVPRAEGTFTCGPEVMKSYPVEATVHFTTNDAGLCTEMKWQPEQGAALTGKPGKFHEDEVSFTNGTTPLAGTLILPPSQGRHPAVVLVAESGPGKREDLRFMADFFALNGVAALVYDQRGVGKSGGDWHNSGFADSAGDALAAVELLRGRTNINPQAVGLWGMGPGGWATMLAASRATNLAFVICLSGSGITPEAQAVYGIEHRLRAGGFSDADRAEALAMYRQDSACAKTGTNWDECETAFRIARNKPWYGRDLTPYDRKNQEQWRLIWNYDPIPALEKVTCPVLALYGELDAQMPAKKCADLWTAAFQRTGNRNATVKIVPQADHGLVDARLGVPGPGFYSLQRDWLLERLKTLP